MANYAKDIIDIDIPALVARIRELEAELQVRDNMGDEVLRILREATGRRDFHSEMEAAEWAAKMLADARRDGARVEAWERMNRKGCRPGCEYDPDRGFIGWGWKHDTYKTWREAMDAAMGDIK